jgi:arginyl-tRNA synthetase
MAGLFTALAARLQPGFDAVAPGADPVLRPSTQPGADFQANGAMALAKRTGMAPADIAAKVVAGADLGGVAVAEVHPRGFINLTVDAGFVASALAAAAGSATLGVDPAVPRWTIVVDYSAPNVAKELHAGHVRTTIVGDALCRVAAFAGHHVIRENHIGDWGTPFGMLIEHLIDMGEEAGAHELSVGDLDGFYRQARAAFDASPELQERARHRVVLLQSGDAETLRLWRVLVDESMRYFSEVYARLGVLLTSEDVVGESFYNDLLPVVVADLEAAGLLVESEGARCVFPPGFAGREGEPLPLIVQKSDGGYGYATTDLAALKDRFGRLGADRALYVVGAPQAQHFAMCFATGRLAGYVPDGAEPVHVAIGNMLGADRKIFRSRGGETVKLIALVDEAIERAAAKVAELSPDLPAEEGAKVAQIVGVGALKYADLSVDRAREYVFDWDRMLSFDGNSAPYLQYAHARIMSIFRRGGIDPSAYGAGRVTVALDNPAERALALRLLGFEAAVTSVLETWTPHKLCTYLFELAGDFTTFFEHCPVLRADDAALRDSRLELCAHTAAVLARGLSLLGIEAPSRM